MIKPTLLAKCHKCDTEMIEFGASNVYAFFCPNSCMQMGPYPVSIMNQKELDQDYKRVKNIK